MPAKPDPMETTAGALLDGRVSYAQPQIGYRTGIEPVLLAASTPARPGDVVLEAGTGAGAGLLCLAARVPGVVGVGVERDPALAALAEANLAANGFAGLSIMAADVLTLPPGVPIDHAMANPPWHLADSTATENGQRDAAKRGRPGLIAAWAQALGQRLRHRGTLTLIVPARALAESLAALDHAGCGTPSVLPLWPRAGVEARIVLIQGIRGGRGGARLLPGLILHEGGQGYSAAAQAILRGGDALPFVGAPGAAHSSPSG
jgi:tRNA1Val (adenine37-N6)-methyltransferase